MKHKSRENTLVCMPAFNEARTISDVIADIESTCKQADILVINDGSTDETKHVAANKGVYVIDHCVNLGIGSSFQSACQYALRHGYRFLVRIDADGQHSAESIKGLVEPIKQNQADIAIGSRFLGSSVVTSSTMRLIGIRIIILMLKILTGKTVTDPTSGLCAMNRKAFDFFAHNSADDYPEPEILVYHRAFRIKEVPVSITKRKEGVSSISPLRSLYYMVKVSIALFVHFFTKRTYCTGMK